MRERLRTLVLDANGFSRKELAADTFLLGVLGARSYAFVPRRLRRVRFFRALKYRYDRLSYVSDWRDALCASPALDVRVCNITNLVDFAKCLRTIGEFDLVVVLHSAAGDSLTPLRYGAKRLQQRRGKLVVLVGNEYDLMAEKFEFLQAARADYVCSQLPIDTARWLYAECDGVQVVPMPHALNPDVYRADRGSVRSIDLGFAGASYPLFIGDIERSRLVRAVQHEAPKWDLNCDFREQTIPRREWAAFLSRCNGTIGAESGTYFLDRRGEMIAAAKSFVAARPAVGFKEVYERFFERPNLEHVSGKCISSRHFEAVGTRTCQVLLEGDYNGILEPETHYISVRKDLSDLGEAIIRFKDDAYRQEIVNRTYEYVMDEHTYAHRVARLVETVG